MPLGLAIFLLIIGALLGSVFTFGMQHWNARVAYDECIRVETRMFDYKEFRKAKRPSQIKEIAIDCANNERYFIDGSCINTQLCDALSIISREENIILLIHPNSNSIVEFSTEESVILKFDETISKLGNEATGFLFLGVFMYFCALMGLYYVVFHSIQRYKKKR